MDIREIKMEETVVVSREDAVPGKFFPLLEVHKPAEVGIGFHGFYMLKNVKIIRVISNFNAVGPGSDRVSLVLVSGQAGNKASQNRR